MPIEDSDIVFRGSAQMPENDADPAGGAIAPTVGVVFVDVDPNGTVEAVSDNAGDTTQTLTITGRDGAGELATEAKTLTGTTAVAFTTTWSTILKAVLSGAATGNVTIRETGGGDDLMVMEPGLLQMRRPFYDVAADAAGGAQRVFYEKIFSKNAHATLSLTDAVISELSDPSGKIAFALETTLDGSGASANRRTAPASGVGTFDSNAKNVANAQNHSAGAGQGIWLQLTLNAGDVPAETTYGLRESGTTS